VFTKRTSQRREIGYFDRVVKKGSFNAL